MRNGAEAQRSESVHFDEGFRADLVVLGKVLLELKSVELSLTSNRHLPVAPAPPKKNFLHLFCNVFICSCGCGHPPLVVPRSQFRCKTLHDSVIASVVKIKSVVTLETLPPISDRHSQCLAFLRDQSICAAVGGSNGTPFMSSM